MKASNVPATLVARLWAKVKRTDDASCWEWAASRTSTGYGQIRLGNRPIAAHRAAWIVTRGDIPDGTCVLHRCDNPLCVNPSHLFLGTHRDNTRDMMAKGRNGYKAHPGTEHVNAKLTEMGVRVIRRSRLRTRVLVRIFGVHRDTIISARNGRSWRHVPMPRFYE